MINNYKGKIHIVYDCIRGYCGKGKFCGQLARDKSLDIKICVNNNAPNAGHTFVYNNRTKILKWLYNSINLKFKQSINIF